MRLMLFLILIAFAGLPLSLALAQKGEERIVVAPKGKPLPPPPGRPMDMFDDADTDGNGVLSRQEFLGRAEAHFKEMDMDADGLVTQDEMRALGVKKRLQVQQLMKKEAAAPKKE